MIRHLYLRYARNDLRQNLGVTVSLLIVLALSAFLMSSGAMMLERLSGAVGQVFSVAQPPHFLQMHRGDYDPVAIAEFAEGRADVDSWLIEEMIGFDGLSLEWERPDGDLRGDLSVSLIDNLFVTQNSDFDFLLSVEDDGIPLPADGEVYIPVAYGSQFGLEAGDAFTVQTASGPVSLVVAGVIRDAQMASSMSSATRFLVSETDFARLASAGGGSPEIIVEFRLHDVAALPDLQRAYESNAALPKNGQAVTDAMIRVISLLSDGLVAIAFMFSSLMLIGIALVNARFVIRASLEEDIHEIGAMKAIGISARTISGLYLARFGVLAAFACVTGGVLSLLAIGGFTGSIRENFAEPPVSPASVWVPVVALTVVFLMVMGICAATLRAVGRTGVVDALIHGSSAHGKRAARAARRQAGRPQRAAFPGGGRRWLSLRLVLRDLRRERRDWGVLPVVFLLTTILITLPLQLLTTLESPAFITYMGAPTSDLRADIDFIEDGDTVSAELRSALTQDKRVDSVTAFAGMLYETPGEDGWETFRVEVGDYGDASLVFHDGKAPATGEIALSVLNAEKLGLGVGDELRYRAGDTTRTASVSGVYQDITSGGYTAKMQGQVDGGADRWTIYVDLAEGIEPSQIAAEYDALYTGASVIPMQSYMKQTLSHVTSALRSAVLVTLMFGLGTAALITALFMRLRLSKDRPAIGVLTMIGFSLREITAQLRVKVLVTVLTGVILGSVCSALFGDQLISFVLSVAGVGIQRLVFIPNVFLAYTIYPLILCSVGVLSAVVLTRQLRHADRTETLTS